MAIKIVSKPDVSVREIIAGYQEQPYPNNRVVALNGRLEVRPPYQRQCVYDDKEQALVIDSILKGCPIGVMYWVKTGVNQAGEDMYECLDGQQRIISLGRFYQGKFAVKVSDNGHESETTFGGLRDNKLFLDYGMFTVYIVEADTLEEKLAWFERINVAGKALKPQEMRSAIACGEGTTLAKKYFVSDEKNGANAYSFDMQSGHAGRDYVSGEWDRQTIYEKAIIWKLGSKKPEDILTYMKNHRDDKVEAETLFEYFKNVIRWVKWLFPDYDKDMAKVEWGLLYGKYGNNTAMSPQILRDQVKFLRADVGKGDGQHLDRATGIYEFVLAVANGVPQVKAVRLLSPRAFSLNDKKAQYERQRHVCPHCMKRFEDISMMQGDHIVPYNPIPASGQLNGTTTPDNLQMLCHRCNLDKSNKPFDKAAEMDALQKLYAMSDTDVAALPEGKAD